MNNLIVNSRAWLNEFRNGATFATDTGVNSTYFKENTIERVKLTTSVTIRTSVLADVSTEILFTDLGATATFTHPYLNWSTEGFKIGDTIKLIRGVNSIAATISNLSGMVLTCNDAGIAAALFITTANSYPDLEVYNTTVPTSLVYQFGIVPNVADPSLPVLSPNPYASLLDGQLQSYKADSIGAGVTTLTGSMTGSAEISESVKASWISTAANGYDFTFEVYHIFRVEFFKADWLTNLINNTSPASFTVPNSYRYINYMKFGTSSTDPNENRIFKDSALNGALGFIDNSFNQGTGNYELVSIAYEDAAAVALSQIEVTEVTTVTIQIQKTSGNFAVGQKAIVYLSKLPDSLEYSNLTDTWNVTHVFDTLTQVDGAAAVNSTIISGLIVDVNVTPSLLDITFDVTYSTAQKLLLEDGDRYFIGVTVGDITLSAALSDRKCVWCDVNTFTKNSDIPDLITGLDFECYSSEKTPNGSLSTTNVDTWINRLHMARVNFLLTKTVAPVDGKSHVKITAMSGQIVFRDSVTLESFVMDDYSLPISPIIVAVGGSSYQAINFDGTRDFNILSTAEANKVSIDAEVPVAFDATQQWTVRWPFVINWREWKSNPNVPTTFINFAESLNNLNDRASNYDTGNWVMYIRLLVTVNTQGVNTQYSLYSTACVVRDFDAQPDGGHTWVASTKLYDEAGNEVQDIIIDQDIRIETTFTEASVSGLTLANLFASHTIEETGSVGQNCRLHSSVDWGYSTNLLKPLSGQQYVKVTQNIVADTIVIESLIDKNLVNNAASYNVYTHLEETR